MKRLLPFVAAIAILLPYEAGAQVVADSSRRSTLEAISDVVDAPSSDLDQLLAGVGDPFLANAAAVPASTAPGATAPVTEGEALLSAAARVLGPTGLLSAEGRSYLSLADGTLCEVGVPFSLKLPAGTECRALVLSADDSLYTLRIDGSEKAFPYTIPSGGATSD